MSGKPQLASDPQAVKLLRRLDGVVGRLATAEDRVDTLADERNDLFCQLLDMGVTQREVASRSNLSEPAVAKAVRKARAKAEDPAKV